ncbi:MAG: Gfo/Idh/MocA family oxidoreductase [Phycisphaeraceae bacterium]|nr:Gfo/Idh/MocA family oxidoreductase [Phycisphaeraceae bacterium]
MRGSNSHLNVAGNTRRDFLVKTAALAGAGALLAGAAKKPSVSGPSSSIKAAKRVPVPDGQPIRLGVIGTGGMGTGHCDAIIKLTKDGRTNVQIVAVCDVCDSHMARAKKLCEEKQPGVKVDSYRKHEDLLAREDIHAVLIASPEHWHAQHAIDAITAGKDVYLEKPMTLRLDEALALREYSLKHPDVILQIGTQMMQLPRYHEARKLIRSGEIGHPTLAQTSYCRSSKDGEWNYYAIDKNWKPGENLDWDRWCGPLGSREWDPKIFARWRRYRDFSTGIIGDLLVHVVTPLLLALDSPWPTRVVACGSHIIDKDMENHDLTNLAITMENGTQMIVAGSTCNEVGLETLIRGYKANLYLGSVNCQVRPERLFVDEVEGRTIECENIGNDQDVHRVAFFDCVRSRNEPPAGVDLSTKVMVIVDLATRSMWEGKAFTFDPKTMTASPA